MHSLHPKDNKLDYLTVAIVIKVYRNHAKLKSITECTSVASTMFILRLAGFGVYRILSPMYVYTSFTGI